MTKGCKIWLWFIFICNIISCVSCLALISLIGILGAYSAVVCAVMIAGIALLLFKQKKVGFYIMLVMAVVAFIVNIMSGVSIIYALASAVVSPAVTYYFIGKNSDVIK
ncbi:MAG: hypothetical protein LUG24_06610 [Clostridiales bacterium]|nr:hypothetical protein [Clostridiales bacterium]